MLTAKRVGRIESQRERAVESHISRKTSEMWATRHLWGNEGTHGTYSEHAVDTFATNIRCVHHNHMRPGSG